MSSTQNSINDPLGLSTVAHGKHESKDYIRGASDQFLLDEKKVKVLIQSERDRAEEERMEIVETVLKMADALELECGLDGDKGTKQWMAFKGFRNTIRDKFLTNPQPHE